ncbi:MAG: FAD-dependent oxidoreductase [Myxococcaceae bacterium]
MAKRTVVILGGALSGPTAAARARETDEQARIVLISKDARVAYAASGIPFHLSGEVKSVAALDRERAEFFRDVYGIEVMTRTAVKSIDAVRKSIALEAEGKASTLGYDALVFALGARMKPMSPKLEGTNVNSLRTLEELEAVQRTLSRVRGRKPRVTVIGGGIHGLAIVDGLVRRGAEVTLLERGAALLPQFGPQVTRLAHEEIATRAKVHTGAEIILAHAEKGKVTRLGLSNGEEIACDFVVVTAGIAPRTELLAAAGAHLAPDGSVYVTERAETSLPDIYACGICVSVPQLIGGAHTWNAQGAVADKVAQVAGANAAGGSAKLSPVAGTVLRRCLSLTLGRTGLSEAQARAFVGANFDSTTIHAPSHDPYFPGSAPVLVQLFWDKSNGRLLGAEVAGKSGVDKRIDVCTAAIAGQLLVETLATLDFGYAPPYGSQRDPINVAATVAAAERAGQFKGITVEELQARLGQVQVVDVREAKESAKARVPGALAIPLEQLRERKKELSPKGMVVSYCGDGRRGFLAARILSQSGFSDVRNLEGGLRSWQLMERTVEKGARK